MRSRLIPVGAGAIAGLLIVALVALARILEAGPQSASGSGDHRSAMEIAAAFTCHPAETRHVIVGGKEDDFLPTEDEVTSLSDRMRSEYFISRTVHSRYDQDRPNYMFADHFITPRPATGLFVIRMRPIVDNDNDGIFIGDLTKMLSTSAAEDWLLFSSLVPDLGTRPGWQREGDVYFARFEEVHFQQFVVSVHSHAQYVSTIGPVDNLNDYLRAAAPPRIIDVVVDDDTSVDVIILVVCEEPARRAGMTLSLRPLEGSPHHTGWLYAECDEGGCGALAGDTACDEALPLLCFRDCDAPAPDGLGELALMWSGGEVAVTTPVPASRFSTHRQASEHCAAIHGAGWRVASYHEGARGGRFLASGQVGQNEVRVWAHAADQPYGVCWAAGRTGAGARG